MIEPCDLLLVHSKELLTIRGASKKPKASTEMQDLGVIQDGALAIKDGRILEVGPTEELEKRYKIETLEVIDASGKVVLPGFIDPHTHAVFGGTREEEFTLRLQGKSYLEILKEGGGILSTVRATRALSAEELAETCKGYLDNMLLHGTTTVEIKSGYGLNLKEELKILEAIELLKKRHPIDIVPTFLGAHAVPAEFRDNPKGYVEEVIDMLPRVKGHVRFCDVFCDEGAFSLEDSRKILERAKALGFGIKLHAGEFKDLGGTSLAAELGACSVDHLDYVNDQGIESLVKKGVVGVLLPGVPFFLRQSHFAPARKMIEKGLPVALGTDFNPGSCPTENMQLIITLACLEMGLSPEEAINAATINSAHAIGIADQVGSLEPGKKADIVILDIPSYKHLSYRFGTNHVDMVIKAGTVAVEEGKIVLGHRA